LFIVSTNSVYEIHVELVFVNSMLIGTERLCTQVIIYLNTAYISRETIGSISVKSRW